MTETSINNDLFAVVIKVEDIEKMRIFYRDVLQLDPPVVDSNYWVEFKISESMYVILDKTDDDEILPKDFGRISWLYQVDDLDEFVKILENSEIKPFKEERERFGKKVLTFLDPEGNPFQLIQKMM